MSASHDAGSPGQAMIGNVTATDALGPAHGHTVSCWDPTQVSPASVLNFPARDSTSTTGMWCTKDSRQPFFRPVRVWVR